MSVIVGIKDQGITYLGTDSQMTKGSVKKHYTHIDNRKTRYPDRVSHLLLVTKTSSDFDIEIASNKRSILMNQYKKSIKKVGALSDN